MPQLFAFIFKEVYAVTYIVMRNKGLRTDGYYYESDTTIFGLEDTEAKAKQLLDKAIKKYHPNEQPMENPFDKEAAFILSAGLYDYFWIEAFRDYTDLSTDSNDEDNADDQRNKETFDDSGSTD